MIMDGTMPTDPTIIENSELSEEEKIIVNDLHNDVEEICKLNPELSEIGTREQYIEYLKTIFPESKIKYILWHNSNAEFKEEGFKPMKPNFDTLNSQEGVYNFTTNREFALRYGTNAYPVRLDVCNPIVEKSTGEYQDDLDRPLSEALFKTGKQRQENPFGPQYDESLKDTDAVINVVTGEGYVKNHPKSGREIGVPKQIMISVFDQEQIHILGTDRDIENFRQFVTQ